MLILKVCTSTQTHTQVWNHLNVFWSISFLLLLQQITTYLEALNHTNLLSYSSGGQKSTAGPRSCFLLEVLGKDLFLAFSISISHQQSGSWPHALYSKPTAHQFPKFLPLSIPLLPASHCLLCETLLPLSYKDPCDYKGLAWIIFPSQKSLT